MTPPDETPNPPQDGAPEQAAEGTPPEETATPAAEASAEVTPPVEQPAVTPAEPEAESSGVGAVAAGISAEKPAPAPKAERPARPAKEAEPKEAPRVVPPAGSINELLAAAVPDVALKAYMVPSLPGEVVAVEVARDDIPAVMTACRNDERLDLKYLRCLSGVDWQEEGLEVVYHLWSFTKRHHLTVKTRVTYDDAVVPSVAALYPAADWHERETRDMFGIHFEGHPNLVPLLLPEDLTDHFPLRKDNPLQEIEEWQGENLREGAGEDE